jgi:transcriptional regulator with XRE-family HTH domain
MNSGSWIRKLREDRTLRAREIERLSRRIVEATGNPDYYVSHASLADIEAGAVPSIFKLFSLSCFLGISYDELLHVFGVDPAATAQYVTPVDPTKTALVPLDARENRTTFHPAFGAEGNEAQTNLLPASPEKWPALPLNVFKFDGQRYRYALIGSGDDSMRELIPPGSLVEVDTQQTSPESSGWRALRERPIYLVWHADGYTCCWCQLERGELTLVPHPSSQQPVRRYKTPRDATVVGRVVAAWMPFAETNLDNSLLM